MFSTDDEILELADIIGTSYTQIQAVNIAYVILHRTGNFGLAIREWNHMPEIQNMLVRFKQFFRTSHQELRETSDLTIEETGMHHSNMASNVVAGLQEDFQQEQSQTETAAVV